jgi:hypothetical protein
MRCSSTARLITAWLITLSIDFSLQSEILIIRHGRSRSRHSVEKDHVRWGLKALDNLTLIESRFEESFENETNGELNVVNLFENNGSLTQSNEFNATVGSFEINFTHSPSGKIVGDDKKHHHDRHRQQQQPQVPTTTEISKSASISGKRRSGRKKEIMTYIKSTVNKGIQYLKSHENLDEIQIEINDLKRTTKSNKKRTQSKPDQTTLLKQQRKKQSPMQIKINGGKELGIVTILRPEIAAENPFGTPTHKAKKMPSEKSISQRHAAKHIKSHQARSNQIDLDISSNLADVFYVGTSTEEPFVDEQMQGDAPAGKHEEVEKSLMENSNQRLNKANRKSSAVASNSTKSTKSETVGSSAAQVSDVLNGNEDSLSNLRSDVLPELMSPMDRNGHERHENNQQNDQIDIENEDFMNTVQNDGDVGDENSENGLDIESESDFDENNVNGIYHVEDLDLSDFDETSRNNRKNLMRGRDVVTRFLQIVESQHVLGGNCTAGTALNLGEGVVDRYAQDRFRVEAEVAVNRANMLTR